jgi:hypothetical protein
MIYRGPGFLAVVWFGSSLNPSPPFPVTKLSLFLSLPVCRRLSLLTGVGRRGWGRSQIIQPTRKPGPLQIIQRSLHCYKWIRKLNLCTGKVAVCCWLVIHISNSCLHGNLVCTVHTPVVLQDSCPVRTPDLYMLYQFCRKLIKDTAGMHWVWGGGRLARPYTRHI